MKLTDDHFKLSETRCRAAVADGNRALNRNTGCALAKTAFCCFSVALTSLSALRKDIALQWIMATMKNKINPLTLLSSPVSFC